MWRVYYNNEIDPIEELGIYDSRKQAISVKRTFIYNSTKNKIYSSYEESRTDYRQYNIISS